MTGEASAENRAYTLGQMIAGELRKLPGTISQCWEDSAGRAVVQVTSQNAQDTYVFRVEVRQEQPASY